jgi:hypothetical protein
MTTAAAIDRLVHHSVILELNIPSYRIEQAKKNQSKSEDEPRPKERWLLLNWRFRHQTSGSYRFSPSQAATAKPPLCRATPRPRLCLAQGYGQGASLQSRLCSSLH